MPFYKGRSRPKWFPKPIRNTAGLVPKPITTGRKIKTELVPRVDNLIKGGVIPKPLWYDAVLAHPPTLEHKMAGPRPKRFEWREEDRLRRVWQRRNPEASMFPKVLFLDETQLPPGTQTTHPADVFVRKQLAMMRKHNLSEEEAYRRVLMQQQQKEKIADEEVQAAREQAKALGASPAVDGAQKFLREGFAARLLRRFAEEARDSKQPFPKHWFADGPDGERGMGEWRGLAQPELESKTVKAFERTAAQQQQQAGGGEGEEVGDLFAGLSVGDKAPAADATKDKGE